MARTGENIYKRKDGRWEARFILNYDSAGKARYKYLYGPTYTAVKAKLLQAQTEPKTRLHALRDSQSYTYWLNEWLCCKKLSVKSSTYIRYRNTVDNHIKPILGEYPISKIDDPLINAFVSEKIKTGRLDGHGGLATKTVTDIVVVMKESFRFAQSAGATTNCSFERLSLRKSSQEMRVLSAQEQHHLITVLTKNMDRYKLGVFVCLFTGIRIGELCALQWKHISFSERTIKIEQTIQRLQCEDLNATCKTHIVITEPKSFCAIRAIPITDFVAEYLKPLTGMPTDYILSGESDTPIEPRTMQNRFKTYLREAQIADANFHALRHTFATRCVEAGFDIKTLSEILGHSSVKITLDRYVHSSMELKRENMGKLKMLR